MRPPPNLACTSSSFRSGSVSRLRYTVFKGTGTTLWIRTSDGCVSPLRAVRARVCRTWENDCSASDEAGIWSDECGRAEDVSADGDAPSLASRIISVPRSLAPRSALSAPALPRVGGLYGDPSTGFFENHVR
jgi:hypothetical protein